MLNLWVWTTKEVSKLPSCHLSLGLGLGGRRFAFPPAEIAWTLQECQEGRY